MNDADRQRYRECFYRPVRCGWNLMGDNGRRLTIAIAVWAGRPEWFILAELTLLNVVFAALGGCNGTPTTVFSRVRDTRHGADPCRGRHGGFAGNSSSCHTAYASDSRFVPMLRRDERRRLMPGTTRFSSMRRFASGSRCAARPSSDASPRSTIDCTTRPTASGSWFGFFEATDAGVARQLLAVVERHAAGRGSTAVRGR